MKQTFKIIGTLAYLLIGTLAFAQVPQKFNYQGIARDIKGNPIGKQQMTLKLSVLPTSDASVPEYEETQTVTTNEFGLYTLQIGNGNAITGDMKTVAWETGNKYIKVAIDPKGGSDFVDAGTSQLLSVPYAIYADKAGTAVKSDKETRTGAVSSSAAHVAGDANYVTKFTALNTIGKSLIYDNGSNIGIGTTTPLASGRLHITSATGTQPLILESPQGVHNLVRENGVNRGYFGSYIGSGGAYPTPAGTSNEDFDIGTSGASTGKLHFATNTTPRVSIMPTTGNVGIGTTSPTTKLEVVSNNGDFLLAKFKNNSTTGDRTSLISIENGNATPKAWYMGVGGSGNGIGLTNSPFYIEQQGSGTRMLIDSLGRVGIGTNTPSARLQVPAAADTAILGTFSSNNGVGVYGNSAGSGYGAGVVGRAFGGAGTIPTFRDIGVYGASSDVAVWSQGKLKVVDGSEGAGKVLVSDATGTATWRTGTKYTNIAIGSGQSATLGNTLTKIGVDIGTFTKIEAGSKIEINFNTFLQFSTTTGTGAKFELRIDDLPTTTGIIKALVRTPNQTDQVNMFGVFENLSAGTHTISLWGQTAAGGTTTGAGYDLGNFSTSNIIVKETN